jgi:hypothetical protein
MRLGLSSIVGDGFGTGSFGVDGPSTPPSFPPAGTYYDTQYGVEYPIAEGGAYLISPVDSSQVPNQVCDVDREHDGSGGIVYDWATATNVQYKSAGTTFYNAGGGSNTVYVTELGASYTSYTWNNLYYQHDGFGGYQSPDDGSYTSGGTIYGTYGDYTDNGGINFGSTPISYTDSGGFFQNWYYVFFLKDAVADGSGSYTINTSSSTGVYPSGYVFYSHSNYTNINGTDYENGTGVEYAFDGTNGYNSNSVGSYYSYGTFIFNDGTTDYYWDGSGGYYT